MLLDSCGFELNLRAEEEMLVTGRNVIQRPVRGKSPKTDAGLAPECGRGQAGQRTKLQAERSEAFVTQVEADIRNAVILGKKELFGFIHSDACDELVRCLGECLREQAVEMIRGEAGVTRGLFQGDAVTVASREIVAGPREAGERDRIEEPSIAPESKFSASRRGSHGE